MSRSPRRLRREAALIELHSLQQTQTRSADLIGMSRVTCCHMARDLGLKFSKTWGRARRAPTKRVLAMAALYRDGFTLEQIGAQYGITRERVRQVLTKHAGLTGKDGGLRVRAERTRTAKHTERESRYFAKYGCSFEQWQELRRIGADMVEAGRGVAQTPLRAWSNQRNNAIRRGIAWDLNVWEWWTVWQQSGHWGQRGRGMGYVMCRKGDIGPYAVGNVYIATAAHNSSEGQRKKRRDPDLPIGVRRNKSGTYTAQRHVNGKNLRLGTHPTPELAYAAYLMAYQPEASAA